MKSYTILLLIFASILLSALLYANKSRSNTDDIDKVAAGLAGVKPFLSPTSSLSFRAEPNDDHIYSRVRYILVPRYISIDTQEHFDTTLVIRYVRPLDTMLSVFIQNQHILWQHKDSVYSYTLTRKP